MGIILDSIPALIVNSINNRRNRINRNLFNVINTHNLIMCGGNDIVPDNRGNDILTLSGELKINTCFQALYSSKERHKPAVFFCNTNYRPSIIQNLNDSEELIFGENVSYSPLATLGYEIKTDDIIQFFDRIIKSNYGIHYTYETDAILGVIKMITAILESVGNEYITVENINIISNDLFCCNETEFIKKVKSRIGCDFSPCWKNYLTLQWDISQTKYHSFWSSFMNSIEKYNCKKTNITESLYSILSDNASRNIVVCPLSPSNDKMLKSILMSEMEMINRTVNNFNLIDYHVSLLEFKDYYFMKNVNYCIVGNSLYELGIERMIFNNPTLVCLGVENSDAEDIINLLVATGHWIRVTVGYGIRPGHLNVGFAGAEIKPITTSDLSTARIHEGSAMQINSNGYTFIQNVFI